jgi:hypothetical protein
MELPKVTAIQLCASTGTGIVARGWGELKGV